jgi:hypothetical protein
MTKPRVKTSNEVIDHINPERPVFVYRKGLRQAARPPRRTP